MRGATVRLSRLRSLGAAVICAGSAVMTATAGTAQTKGPVLLTRWAKTIPPKQPLPEYPRPQLVRQRWLNLNGSWDYAIRDTNVGAPDRYDGTILVPYPVESRLSGVQRAVTPGERVWYRRTFRTPRRAPGDRLLLHFGAVDWEATVFVNGRQVGQHRGGYDPFTIDITDALRSAPDQELVVRVWDPTDAGTQPVGKQILTPNIIFYTAVTGIWQTVWLEPVPRASIRGLKITPDVDAGAVRIQVAVDGAKPDDRVRVAVLQGSRSVGTASGRPGDTITVRVPRPRLWSPDDPFLYGLEVGLSSGDKARSYFGMRKIALVRDSAGFQRFALNGKILFQLGALDQGYWPDGLYTAPTDAALQFDIEQAKRMHLNVVRKHLKVEPDRWYYHADRLGLLVWQDMPAMPNRNVCGPEGKGITPPERKVFADELRAMVDAVYDHPAVIMWVLFNGGMGQHDTKQYVDWIRGYDPTRLVNASSGLNECGIETGTGDVVDMHHYGKMELPPLDGRRAGVLSEFGGLGLAVPGHLWPTDPFAYQTFDTPEALAQAYGTLIDQIRSLEDKGLAAALYTQLTDVEGEINGLLTYDRAVVKLPAAVMQEHAKLYRPAR